MMENSAALDAIDLQLLHELQRDAGRSNLELARRLHISPPTCLRRIKRLQAQGFIERQVAILSHARLAEAQGHGLQAIVEVSLDKQDSTSLLLFEKKAVAEPLVQQCWRVSPGPDFILVMAAADMPGYLELSQRLFTQDMNVRNVKSFFSIKRAKFGTEIPLLQAGK